MSAPLVQARGLSFSYGGAGGGPRMRVLEDVSFDIRRGDFVAIQGPSGSGKSTLFYLLGALLAPDQGKVWLSGTDVFALSADERARLRNERVGFVFQQFHLLARASVLDNILLPASYPAERDRDPAELGALQDRARELAARLGLEGHLHHLPNQLSGGQQQRVAIARALLKDVDLILADEPTGNLDSRNAEQTLELFQELNRQGKTIVLITHDPEVARRCKRTLVFRDGKLQNSDKELSPEPPRSAAPSMGRRSLAPTGPGDWMRMARAALPLAWENLFRNKTKSFLTMIGVVVGVSAVLAMVTFARFTERGIMASFGELGANKITVDGHRNWRMSGRSKGNVAFQEFNLAKDIEPLRRIFPEVTSYSPMLQAWGQYTVAYSGRSVEQIRPLGVSPTYLPIANRRLRMGAPISEFHVGSRSPVCLLGFEIARQLFVGEAPGGQIVFVSGDNGGAFSCRVIGVLEPQSSNSEWFKPDLQLVLPYTYFQSVAPFWFTRVEYVVLETRPGTDTERLSKGILAYFKRKYGDSGRFDVGSDAVMQAQIQKFLALFSILISSIAMITLGVGGMGINNMMLVSVSERLKEIGLRKAVGATDRSIRTQLLVESTLLCSIAGMLGIGIGFSAYQSIIFVASKFVTRLKFEWVFEPWAMGTAAASIVAVGILSGLTPALKAERLQVIEALRAE